MGEWAHNSPTMASGTTRISIDGQVVSTASNANITAGAGQNTVNIEGYLDDAFISGGGNDDYMYINLNNEGAAGSSDYVSFRDSIITGGNGDDYMFVYNSPSSNNNNIIDTSIRGGAANDRIVVVGDLDADQQNGDADGLITIGEGAAIEGDGGLQNGALPGNDEILLDEVKIDSGVVRGQGGNDYIRLDEVIASNAAIVNGNDGEDFIYVDNSELNSNARVIGGANDDYIFVDDTLLTTSTWVNGSKGDDLLGLENSILDGSDGEVVVRGNDGDDFIFLYQSAASNIKVNGSTGNDYIVAADSNVGITAGTFQSTANAVTGVSDSEILGGTGDDFIFFYNNTGGGNLLSGQEGCDVLWASNGSLQVNAGLGDRLDGGTGADWAFTGTGDDTYVFESGDGVAATGVLASNLFENFFTIPGEGNDFELNALYWSDGVDVLITQDGIGGFFDFLDDDVEFNGKSFSVEDIVFFGSTSEVGIATINEQGDFVSVVEGTTSAYVVLGAFGNIGQTGLQPLYNPCSETAFLTQYIEPGIGLNSDLEDYFDALGGVDAALFFDAGESLGVGNDIGYEEVSDLFIVTTRDEIPSTLA